MYLSYFFFFCWWWMEHHRKDINPLVIENKLNASSSIAVLRSSSRDFQAKSQDLHRKKDERIRHRRNHKRCIGNKGESNPTNKKDTNVSSWFMIIFPFQANFNHWAKVYKGCLIKNHPTSINILLASQRDLGTFTSSEPLWATSTEAWNVMPFWRICPSFLEAL